MKKISLVILAAGMGTRFGDGIKQLTPVGPSGEIIIDYSVYDAIETGFNQIVFIIRRDIEDAFREAIGNRIERIAKKHGVDIQYAYQEQNDLPSGFLCPTGRSKPWGTGHALLTCRNLLDHPFVVINADDYYGKSAFQNLFTFLSSLPDEAEEQYCMAGFLLGKTLSENGGVTRGICEVDGNGYLKHVKETKNIVKTETGAAVEVENLRVPVAVDSHVSMNMWGFTPDFLKKLDAAFQVFLNEHLNEPASEFLLPIEVERLLGCGISVKVIPTEDRWYGITFQDDIEAVREAFHSLCKRGVYTIPLYNNEIAN